MSDCPFCAILHDGAPATILRRGIHSLVIRPLGPVTEDNLARLRDTPAGKQLLAEGWDRGWDSGHGDTVAHDDGVSPFSVSINPYRP